ncbi:MAG TPA: MASE3 domain-containing protein [Clostridia bacterium]|nr:MASE3 domain-containing protein [Clostridia bacterium]
MIEIKLNTDYCVNTNRAFFLRYMLIILVSYIIAFFATPVLWVKNVHVLHTLMELMCIFNALATFLIIWNTYKRSFSVNHILGFGFLAVAVFDSFHTYYWFAARELAQGYLDLTTRYWIIGRLVEALVLVAVSLKHREFRINKWIGLSFVLISSFGLSLAVLFFPSLMPAMLIENRPAPVKIALEYVVIALALFSLYNLKDKLKDENSISYKYVFIALLFIIPAELSFTMYNGITSFYNMYGHILKILCYYFMYKAVYVSCVEYPNKKLEEAYDKLEKTNKKINEIDETLNDTLDALPIGIINFNPDNTVKYVNKRLEEILDCDKNNLYGIMAEDIFQVFSKAEKEKMNLFQMTSKNGNEPLKTMSIYKTRTGEYVKLSIISQKIRNGMLLYLNEVKKEQDMRNFHLQTQTILNAVSNCVLMTDQDKKIILSNEAFNKVFEINDIDIIGMSLDEFNEIIDLKAFELSEVLINGEEFDHPREMTITSLKGNRRELLVYATPIRDVESELIGMISVFTDITEIKKQQHNMQQQEKLALIGQMTAGIVHEIKNPLATIKGLSQLIKLKATSDKVKEYSNVINSAIDDVTKVVNEFLSFAKPNPTFKIRTSLNRIVESMKLITETQCYTKNIKSQFHFSSCPIEITADEIKIKQVILNITENAIAAMENVELPELIVSTYYMPESGEGVIKIVDNGIGMSPDVLNKIGTPFFTTKEKGTGLGLGISYQIMNDHNGRIEVESEEGKGTTFKILFSQIENLI